MPTRRSLPFGLFLLGMSLLAASAPFVSAAAPLFSCTGYVLWQIASRLPEACTDVNSGSIYFTGHNTDSLLFQNTDLLHDLYVYKCVTTVVFTSDTGGEAVNETRILERESALEWAYQFMNAAPTDEQAKFFLGHNSEDSSQAASMENELPLRNTTTIQVGKYNISASSFDNMPNVQILYLRLPDSPYGGLGYDAYGGESLKKLYQKNIPSITNVDKNATYTLQDLKDIIATILRERHPADIGILNQKIDLKTDDLGYTESEHTDRITSAKIVWDVIGEANIAVNVRK
jgi:hypothetical protein